jgi:hypothetical protein
MMPGTIPLDDCIREVEFAAESAGPRSRRNLIAAAAHLRQYKAMRLTASEAIERRMAEEAAIKASAVKASAALDRARQP